VQCYLVKEANNITNMKRKFKVPSGVAGFIASLSFGIYLISLGQIWFTIAMFIAALFYLFDALEEMIKISKNN